MGQGQDPYEAFFLEQISLAGLAYLQSDLGAGIFGQAVDLLVNNHCVLHGTKDDKNVKSIKMKGFKESKRANLMLGQGVYGAHSEAKARKFAGKKGTVFCIRFRGERVCLTKTPDPDGTWRKNGYDCIYCDRPGRRSEMCFKEEKITHYSEYTGSLSQETHRKIDEFFLKSPELKDATVYVGVAAGAASDMLAKGRLGACIGAWSGIAMSCLIDNLTGRSARVTKEEIQKAAAEARAFGTAVGCAAGGAAFTAASAAVTVTTTTTEVAAAGVWGWLGYTTTTTVTSTAATYTTAGAATVAGTVALPVAAVAAAVYAFCKLQRGRHDMQQNRAQGACKLDGGSWKQI